MLLNSFAPLSILFGVILFRHRHQLREHAAELLLVLGLAAASFTGGDTERLLSPAVLLLLIVLRPYVERYLSSSRFRAALVICVAACSYHFIYARYGPMIPKLLYYSTALACTIMIGWMGLQMDVGSQRDGQKQGARLDSSQ